LERLYILIKHKKIGRYFIPAYFLRLIFFVILEIFGIILVKAVEKQREVIIMKRISIFVCVVLVMMALLVGCAKQPQEIPESEPPTPTTNDDSEVPNNERNDEVTLTVYDCEKAVNKYNLSAEHSEIITELFYGHEIEKLKSPYSNAVTCIFEVNGDHFSTALVSIDLITGTIAGELFAMELDESEQEVVYQIISEYVPDMTNVI